VTKRAARVGQSRANRAKVAAHLRKINTASSEARKLALTCSALLAAARQHRQTETARRIVWQAALDIWNGTITDQGVAMTTESNFDSKGGPARTSKDSPRAHARRARARVNVTGSSVNLEVLEFLVGHAQDVAGGQTPAQTRAARQWGNRIRFYLNQRLPQEPDGEARVRIATDFLRAVAKDTPPAVHEQLVDLLVEVALAACGITTQQQLDEILSQS
jgi:hypothetical protein